VVNLDGFHEINRGQKSTNTLEMTRKNMRVKAGKSYMCLNPAEENGVDLNRNYDFGFAHDEVGSSNMACAEDYRGPRAFSEPATR